MTALDKMLTLGHQRASSHGSRLIAFLMESICHQNHQRPSKYAKKYGSSRDGIAARVALALRAPVRSRALRGLHRFGKISFFEDNTDNENNNFILTICLVLSTSINCLYCSYCLLNQKNQCVLCILCDKLSA